MPPSCHRNCWANFLKDDLEGTGNKLVGYISAIKKVEIFQLPKVGETIVTKQNFSQVRHRRNDDVQQSPHIFEKLIVSSIDFLIHEV